MDERHEGESAPHPGSRAQDPATEAIARWVEENVDTLARAATDDIWAEVDAYRSTALHQDVVDHVVQIFGVFSATLLGAQMPTVEDFGFTSEHARLRVEHGISLEDFLRAFRIAQLTLWRHINGHLSASGIDPNRGTGVVEHLMRTIEAGSTAAAMTYLDAQQYSIADQERAARECIDVLVSGRQPITPGLRAALRSAGLYDGSPFVVIVARGGSEPLDAALVGLARGIFARTLSGLITFWHQQVVCLAPVVGGGAASLRTRLESSVGEMTERGLVISIGMSAPVTEFESTRAALAEAETACEHLRPDAGVQLFGDLTLLDYLVMHADQTVMRLIGEDVRRFLLVDAQNGSPLLHTLRVYAEHDLNARQAAVALHAHVNTLYYRLAQISDRTGMDMRRYGDVTEVLLAGRLLPVPRPDRAASRV